MKAKAVWTNKMSFTGSAGDHAVTMDAKSPIGSDGGITPKELLAIALCGCTAMDVIALARKYKQSVEKFEVRVEAPVAEGAHPAVATEFNLVYALEGQNIETEKILEAVKLSQTKYCAVSAMLSQSAPIRYTVEVNGSEIGSGQADFRK